MGSLLAELFDQFDLEEQAKIKVAERIGDEIIARGVMAASDRILAAGSLNLNDWSVEPENDARADAAGVCFHAYVNALWRKTYAARSERIPEFFAMLVKLVDAVLARYGQTGEDLLAGWCERCRISITLLQRNTSREALASSAQAQTRRSELDDLSDPVVSFERLPILQFSPSWRMQQKRDNDLNARYARTRHKTPDEVQRQEGLLQDARAWAEAALGQMASEVKNVLELKKRLMKETWDVFVPPDFKRLLGYLEFEIPFWGEGCPSLEDRAIEALAKHARPKVNGQPPTQLQPGRLLQPELAASNREVRGFKKVCKGWVLKFDGKTVVVNDRIGVGYIEHLLRSPDRQFGCIELQASVAGNPVGRRMLDQQDEADLATVGFDREAILDGTAHKQYKERLVSIENELQEAARNNDIGRRPELIKEKEWLIDQLQAATSLGGRPRRFTTEIEKARKAVSAAIKNALEMIGKHHPDLARHLNDRIDRGARCAYKYDGIGWEV